MFGMSLMVHAIGGALLILYMKTVTREKLKITGMPWYLYSAGFFGIFLVVSSSYSIGILGVSVTTCISITGQLVISAVIDHFGWFGVPKVPFRPKASALFCPDSRGAYYHKPFVNSFTAGRNFYGFRINGCFCKRLCHRHFKND